MELKAANGYILIFTLWILVIIMLIVLSLSHRLLIFSRIARHRKNQTELKYLAHGGFHIALSRLMEDDTKVDSYHDDWGRQMEFKPEELFGAEALQAFSQDIELRVSVVDENGKLNLNRADLLQLTRLLAYEELGIGDYETLAQHVYAWKTEGNDYIVMGDGRHAKTKGTPYTTLSELSVFPEITGELLYGEDRNLNSRLDAEENDGGDSYPFDNQDGELRRGLLDYLTLFSDAKININTAPRAVLMTLPRMDAFIAQEIERRRAGTDGILGTDDDMPFTSAEELMELDSVSNIAGVHFRYLSPHITTLSSSFMVIAEARNNDSGESWVIRGTVKREQEALEILSWSEH